MIKYINYSVCYQCRQWTHTIRKCVIKYYVVINDTDLATEFEL